MTVAEKHVRFDLDLSERDIQTLSSADALAAFFARLGYDTNARTVQTPGNLGIGTESTLRPIKHIELLADREGLFQVYLFELTSVTVGHTRALARAFRNRAGNFLLVLTSDYERLDFILLERFLPPAPPGGTIGERQVGIRPRTLTVERRNPGRRALRVLKRLTWTEADSFAQHDKLLAAYAVADWAEEHFNNRALFSDYYLLERLREFAEWREDPKPAYTALRKLYLSAAADHAGKSIGDLKKSLIEPALIALGFDPRNANPTASHDTSDYRLFGPDGNQPLALLLAYPWARLLDGKDDQRDTETADENPGAIVVSLLEKNEAPWVIVTNGRLWRLYARQTHSRATNYYELDAEELLSDTGAPVTDPGEAFRYFWLLFRRQAFEKHPAQREGKSVELSLLDRLLLESEDYARELGSRLKDRVFEDVFPHIAHGFVEHLRAKSGTRAVHQEQLDAIYQGTLTLLYRLLFLLYAEARDLFPVREVRGYWEASLARLKREVAECAGEIDDEVETKLKKSYRDDHYALWERLERLFAVVDRGEAALNVPFYNGGLFLTKPDKDDDTSEAVAARFLGTHRVADRDLARAIDLLSRTVDDKRHSLVFIDYKSLGVRQLGSIYEGLLEFKLRIATEKLAIAKEKGREVYAPFAELDDKVQTRAERAGRMVKKGAVYLENDKRERKASGSYYTPDYIVEYIVEHAVGPVLEEKFEAMRPKLRAAQAERGSFFKKQKALEAKGIAAELAAKAEHIGRELVDDLFDIKVLDPAMGSGHFLVEVVDFITDHMLTFLNAFPWNPVQAHLTETRAAILVEVEQQGVTLDPAKLTDVNLLKRHVLKRCVYGVDLNPMAVELAKVSLWLDCFTLGAPLSFLDHHLRCGNSLIGITEKQFEESQKGQLDLLSGSQYAGAKMAVGAMIEVGLLPDVTPDQTRESRRHYSIAVEALAPVKRLFDVYTSQWFGNTPEKAGKGKQRFEKNPALDFLRDPLCAEWSCDPNKTTLPKHFEQIADTALDASGKYRFFHWELEFPEVFFGPRPGTTQVIERLEGAGFDAVIGNPPYVRIQNLSDQDSAFFETMFRAATGKFDVYLPFVEQGVNISELGGRVGLILPNKFVTADYGTGIRSLISDGRMLSEFVDFGDAQVFPGISTYTCLLFLRNQPTDGFFYRCGLNVESVANAAIPRQIPSSYLSAAPWALASHGNSPRTRDGTRPLSEICKFIFQGLISGGDKLLIGLQTGSTLRLGDEEVPFESQVVFPLLRGKNVQRYRLAPSGSAVIYPYRLDDSSLLSEAELRRLAPETYKYLKRHYDELKNRGSESMEYEAWYAHWCPREASKFTSPKILTQVLAKRSTFAFDHSGQYWFVGGGNAGVYGLILLDDLEVDYWFVLAVLNSRTFDEALKAVSSRFRGGFYSYAKRFIDRVHVRVSGFTAGERDVVARLVTLAKEASLIHDTVETDRKVIESEIDDLVAQLLT